MAVTWGAKTALTTQTAVNNTVEEFLGIVDASDAMMTQVEVLVNNEGATVTDALRINFYATLDAATEDWDDEPFLSRVYRPGTINEEKLSFLIVGWYKFRIGVLSNGATNAYTAGANYRKRTA